MTGAARQGIGPLGRRLLAAFVLVALSSVVVLTAAALIGTDRGLDAAKQDDRQRVADRVARVAAQAYADAGGWAGADLVAAQAVADGASAHLVVHDAAGAMVWPGRGMGPGGQGMHAAAGAQVARAAVTVNGASAGTVQLSFAAAGTAGRTVAWWWVAGAAAGALLVAVAVSWYVSRRLTAPLVRLAGSARAFAGGDRTARAGIRAPGELGELARAFDGMADQVVHAEQTRRRLAADVAHELRTPLGALQAGLEELRDGLSEPDPARLASLHDQALRLGRVVQDMAELSAAEAATLSLRHSDVDVARVVTAAVDAQEPSLRAAGLEVIREIHGPVPVRGDADRLHQAAGNLLANTARYCRPGDQVTVLVAATGEGAMIQVADTGPGIDPESLPHVFERLWRGPQSRSVTGSGIGLAVVRELVTAHGGTVAAKSTPGRGAVFTIRLPLADGDGHAGRTVR
ncbi:HAMP domain-containing sensor histidine kinase [Phytohabitans houttuyneae]|uniref:histidine kinase n=1 Tax=Phytohabitans houttuyneae TaxID=1076126 RepID=A0A6V8K6Z0_9ACTN|nr:HAMP domain-containing sensor histidine kinase [Phytohabitans houttuyneae]GFJ80963.1 hypothetical protein Phou_051430 [Phytohabitans houttuyneae]